MDIYTHSNVSCNYKCVLLYVYVYIGFCTIALKFYIYPLSGNTGATVVGASLRREVARKCAISACIFLSILQLECASPKKGLRPSDRGFNLTDYCFQLKWGNNCRLT